MFKWAFGVVASLSIGYLILLGFFAVAAVVGFMVAFSSAWWMGLVCLVVPVPACTINGLVYIGTWGGVNLAAKIVAWITGTAAVALVGHSALT